jgi:hypothetical protein
VLLFSGEKMNKAKTIAIMSSFGVLSNLFAATAHAETILPLPPLPIENQWAAWAVAAAMSILSVPCAWVFWTVGSASLRAIVAFLRTQADKHPNEHARNLLNKTADDIEKKIEEKNARK